MTKNKIFIINILILLSTISYSQKLSEQAEISLLTCSPGDELYATFGHSAIRITDKGLAIDWVYNYGTFNFKVKNFYLKFIRGYLNYQLVATKYTAFHKEYTTDNREVWQTTLNLTPEQKQEVFRFLENNRLPENKYYQYDFFFDNCATRIRDMFDTTLTDLLIYPERNYTPTFRQTLKPYIKNIPWERFGINLLLGLPADQKIDTWSAMYLPDYMDTIYSNIIIKQETEKQKLEVNRKQIIFKKEPIYQKTFFDYLSPIVVFSILLVVLCFVSYKEHKNNKIYTWIDGAIYLIVGFIGLLLLFMWFGTAHQAVVNNLNIIWALPTHFIVAFALFKRKNLKRYTYYFLITAVINSLLLILWKVNPQQYDLALIPILLILIVRSVKTFYHLKINNSNNNDK